jgi:hypothetical protein
MVGVQGFPGTIIPHSIQMDQSAQTSSKEERFSIASLSDRAKSLTMPQKALFDEAWNHLIKFGAPFPIRGVVKIAGKQPIQQVLRGLNGNLIFEGEEQGNRYLQLTLYGALLTGHGSVLANLLVKLLDLVRSLFEGDNTIKEIRSAQIIDELRLTPVEAKSIFTALQLGLPPRMPIWLSGWGAAGDTWCIAVSDEVIDLFNSDDTAAFLDDRLSAGYQQDAPCLLEDRQTWILPSTFATSDFQYNFSVAKPYSEHGIPPYIAISRLDELRAVSSSRFDCTRLVSMCEELNECAARQNPHAVILLTRSILNHIPPAFEFETFAQVAANYGGGGSSFKKATERLENHSRKVADRLTHMPIRDKEVAPTMGEVNFAAEIEAILAEFCRVLKQPSTGF